MEQRDANFLSNVHYEDRRYAPATAAAAVAAAAATVIVVATAAVADKTALQSDCVHFGLLKARILLSGRIYEMLYVRQIYVSAKYKR